MRLILRSLTMDSLTLGLRESYVNYLDYEPDSTPGETRCQ
jgi:hypothetical protein